MTALGKRAATKGAATKKRAPAAGYVREPRSSAYEKSARKPPAHLLSSKTLRVFDFIELYDAAPIDLYDLIKQGVNADYFVDLSVRLHTSKERLARHLGVSRATLDRRAKEGQRLSTEQSERVVGLIRLVGQVQKMVEQSGDATGFDAARWVGDWLEQPNPALGGRRPAELMDTVAGQTVVSGVLAKMQSGAYA